MISLCQHVIYLYIYIFFYQCFHFFFPLKQDAYTFNIGLAGILEGMGGALRRHGGVRVGVTLLLLIWFIHSFEGVEDCSWSEDMSRSCGGASMGQKDMRVRAALSNFLTENVFSAIFTVWVMK